MIPGYNQNNNVKQVEYSGENEVKANCSMIVGKRVLVAGRSGSLSLSQLIRVFFKANLPQLILTLIQMTE